MFDERRFMAQLALAGVTVTQLAKHLGIDQSTLRRKIADDGRFTRKEINEMIDFLKIEDARAIFFA